MDLYSVLDPSPTSSETSFHLIQLPQQLLESIKPPMDNANSQRLLQKYNFSREQCLQFKAKDGFSTPYLTTIDTTFKIRQQNHSNCVMLLEHDTNYLNFDNYLILEKQPTPTSLNLNGVDIVQVSLVSDIDNLEEVNEANLYKSTVQVLNQTPISLLEFDKLMVENNIVPNGDSLIKLKPPMVSILLTSLLTSLLNIVDDINMEFPTSLLSQILTESNTLLRERYHLRGELLPLRLLTYTFLYFLNYNELNNTTTETPAEAGASTQESFLSLALPMANFTLQHNKIIQFLSLTILRRQQLLPLDDLLIQIRLNLPANYLPTFEINDILTGISYTTKKDGQVLVNFLTPDHLANFNTPQSRFEKLFSLKNLWPIAEISPYLQPVNTKALKIEKFCLKYSRVRKQKGQTYVSPR